MKGKGTKKMPDCGTWCKVCGEPILLTWEEIKEDPIKKQSWEQHLCLTCFNEPNVVDRIKAAYERREFDLRASYEREMVDLREEYSKRLEELREQRAAELAEVEEGGSDGNTQEADA